MASGIIKKKTIQIDTIIENLAMSYKIWGAWNVTKDLSGYNAFGFALNRADRTDAKTLMKVVSKSALTSANTSNPIYLECNLKTFDVGDSILVCLNQSMTILSHYEGENYPSADIRLCMYGIKAV